MTGTVGIIGLGKLGMPFAFTCAMAGYKVIGYDMRPEARRLRSSEWEHEAGIDKFQTMADAIEGSPDACLNQMTEGAAPLAACRNRSPCNRPSRK